MSQPRRNVDNFIIRFFHNLVQPARKLWHVINAGRRLRASASIATHHCGFVSEDRVELTELGWSKPWVNNPFLSMVIRS